MSAMNTQIYEEASEWIILHRTDGLDADAKRRFDDWLRESPQHLRAYLEMSTIWEEIPASNRDWNVGTEELIAEARAEANIIPFTERAVIPAQSGIQLESALRSVPAVKLPASRTARNLLAIAAMLIVTIGTLAWFHLQRGSYSTAIGEQRTIALEDGSSVELNARSKIRVHYTRQQRSIELIEGQALFKVAHDTARPFIVDSDGTKVRAVGTQFDVYRKGGGTTITVVEGRVAVAAASSTPLSALEERDRGEVSLGAGEQLTVSATTLADTGVQANAEVPKFDRPVPTSADVEAATAWTQQRLVFDFTPLREVAEEFNRYNRRRLVIEEPSIERINISGSFSSTDPTLLLRFLREQPEISVNETASEIRISRKVTGTR